MQGVGRLWKGADDRALSEHLFTLAGQAEDGSLTFANFVEFDSLYGHRRDPDGYAAHLEWFDAVAGRFLGLLGPGDLAVFTADHGNDPTWRGTDHTRERVPVLAHGLGPRALGLMPMTGVAGLVAAHLGLPESGA
jgi:phosphopentomutase